MIRGDRTANNNVGEVVSSITYDGFGNRLRETRGTTVYTLAYDAANHVTRTSYGTGGEEWQYDAAGNVLIERNDKGLTTTNTYDAQDRIATTVSSENAGTTTTMLYDGAGNLTTTRLSAEGYRYDENTYYNLRYRQTTKIIENVQSKGVNFSGTTSFTYDVNGQLTFIDRGRYNNQAAGEKNDRNAVTYFTYDNDGRILSRYERALNDTGPASIIGAYDGDPERVLSGNIFGQRTSPWQDLIKTMGGKTAVRSNLTSYFVSDQSRPS